jgi:DNA-binding transcriptional LysR family regulator
LPLDVQIFDWLPVGVATNVCLFSLDHRFVSKEVITPEDLVGEALIDIDPQFSSHQMNVNALRDMGANPEIVVEYDANGHDAGFVAAGIGISITSEIIAKQYSPFGLEYRRSEPGAVYHYVVFWQKDRQLSDGLRYAAEQLVAAFSQQTANLCRLWQSRPPSHEHVRSRIRDELLREMCLPFEKIVSIAGDGNTPPYQ